MIPPSLLRRIRVYAVALTVTLVGLILAAVVGGRVGDTPTQPRETGGIPFTDVHPYGANFFLEREPETWKRDYVARMAAAGGLRWARQQILWSDVQPEEDGPYDWAKYDDIVRAFRANGMDVIVRLDWGPRWARADYVPEINNPPDAEHLADYAAFAGAAAEHFADRVRIYQVWNEPNLRTEWGNQPADPAAYARLLDAAATAIRAADSDAVVMAAPLAITTEDVSLSGNMSDVDFLGDMYAAGAGDSFDLLGANAFGMDRSPSDPPSESALNMRRIELQRAVMEEHGDEETAIWLSEYGWNAAPADMPEDRLIWKRVDEAVQAAWTVEGIEWAREHWPWSGVFGIWYFQYHRIAPDRAESHFRMVDLDFTPRRLYAAVRDGSAAFGVAGPGLWDEKSPPVRAVEGWAWVYGEGARLGSVLAARQQGAMLTMDFDGEGVAARVSAPDNPDSTIQELVEWRIDGAAVEPVVAADTAPGTQGQEDPAVVTAGAWTWLATTGLQGGRHVLEIEALQPGVQVDMLRVDGAGGARGPRSVTAALVLLAVLLAIGLARDLRAASLRVPK